MATPLNAYPAINEPADSYGFWIGKGDGSQARRYRYVGLPKELPDPRAETPVQEFQMDQGINHAGYRVTYSRPIDITAYNFPIVLGMVSEADVNWLTQRRDNAETVLISWLPDYNYLAVFKNLDPRNYRGNLRIFKQVTMEFILRGPSNTEFVLA